MGVNQQVVVDGVRYPGKQIAAYQLYLRGRGNPTEIARLIGSTPMAVSKAILRGKRGEPARPRRKAGQASTQPAWTAEKRDKVRRLFGLTMIEIATAVQVPPAELLRYVLHGVVPPSHRVAGPDDLEWRNDAAQLPPPDQDDATILPREAFEAPETDPDFADGDALIEPDRDEDEAELARLAAEEWADDPEATFAILAMAYADVTIEQVQGWSAEQRKQAEEWAGAVHLNASDNDDVVVPTRPDFIPGFKGFAVDRSPITGAAFEPVPAAEVAPPAPARFQQAPAPVSRPVANSGVATPSELVCLVDETGRYLHESLSGMTTNPRFAWKGGRDRLTKILKQLPHLRELDVVAFSK